ncbi:hypothetical protein BH24DEI1_BH24DEI1_13050 [soil metagenome]|nr:ABC transporter permease [Deinococcota bacterium]
MSAGLGAGLSATVNVVRAELFKVTRKRRAYLMALFLWALFPALLLLVGWLVQTRISGALVEDAVSLNALVQAIASPYALSRNVLLLLGNSSPNLLMVVVALLAALLIGEERANNTWKAVLTNQPNRLAVLAGKVVALMLVLGVLLLGAYLFGLLLGLLGTLFLPTTPAGAWGELAGLYLLQWAFALAAVLFASLLVWLIRSLPVAIVAIFFLPAMLEGAVSFYLVTSGLNLTNRITALLQALRLRQLAETLPQYFLSTNLYAPARRPLAELGEVFGAGAFGGPLAGLFTADLGRAALVLLGYGLLFGGLLAWSFTRRDVA